MNYKPKARSTLICIVSYALTVGVILAGCSQPESKDKLETTDIPSASSEDAEPKSTLESAKPDPIKKVSSSVRSADSHVHGGAVLSIVSESDGIQIEFETPLYNLLGFEYEPKTDAERALASKVEMSLTQPHNLFRFNDDTKCTFVSPPSKVTLFEALSEAGHDQDYDGHDQEDGHDHSDHHDTGAEAEDHDHEEHHQHEDDDSHKDVFLTYSMACQAIEKLQTVKVELFEIFPNLTELELVYLGPSQQMSADLTPLQPKADLTR